MRYSIIKVSGDDRVSFLQGQLTQDVEGVTSATGLGSAWCNPKGRVIATCRIFAADAQHFLVVPADIAEPFVKRLTMYRLRAAVDIEPTDAYRLIAISADRALSRTDGVARLALPFPADFIELFATPSALDAADIDETSILSDEDWSAARCATGLCEIGAVATEQYTPHMLNLDRTGAISFSKGCYTGQEVVARTENLGKVKRRVNRYRMVDLNLAPGDSIESDNAVTGRVVNAAGTELLGVTPVDRHADTLDLEQGQLVPQPLPYAI